MAECVVDAEKHGADPHIADSLLGDVAVRRLEPLCPLHQVIAGDRIAVLVQNVFVSHHFLPTSEQRISLR
jgi:hypothetical protein